MWIFFRRFCDTISSAKDGVDITEPISYMRLLYFTPPPGLVCTLLEEQVLFTLHLPSPVAHVLMLTGQEPPRTSSNGKSWLVPSLKILIMSFCIVIMYLLHFNPGVLGITIVSTTSFHDAKVERFCYSFVAQKYIWIIQRKFLPKWVTNINHPGSRFNSI
jgi:hypothetical protein